MSDNNLGNTSTGIKANISGLLCYLGGVITAIIFLFAEKENKFVKFHAVQSFVMFGGLFIISLAAKIILPGALEDLVSLVVGLSSFLLWIVMMYKAYNSELFKLPIAGDVAEKHSSSI